MPFYDIQCERGHSQSVWRTMAARRDPCPDCGATVELIWTGKAQIIGDEIPGGAWQENGLYQPAKFYSKSERDKALAANGCEIRQKWEAPGKLINWAMLSQKTLEDAKVLLSRGRREPRPDVSIQARVEWE